MSTRNRIAFALVSALAGSLVSFALVTCKGHEATPGQAQATSLASNVPTSGQPQLPTLSPGSRTEDERNTISVFQKTAKSCVYVTQRQVVMDYLGGTAQDVPAGAGSGFIWD